MISHKGDIIEASSFCVDYLRKGLDKERWERLLNLHQRSVSILYCSH
jgi:hypothetical protein